MRALRLEIAAPSLLALALAVSADPMRAGIGLVTLATALVAAAITWKLSDIRPMSVGPAPR